MTEKMKLFPYKLLSIKYSFPVYHSFYWSLPVLLSKISPLGFLIQFWLPFNQPQSPISEESMAQKSANLLL